MIAGADAILEEDIQFLIEVGDLAQERLLLLP